MRNFESYVIYVIDTETTGTDYKNNDIVEISAMRLIQQDDFSFEREQKTWYLKSTRPEFISDEALKVNGHKRDDILHLTKEGREKYREPSDVISEFELWILQDQFSSMDRVFAGQNPRFDLEFLKEFYRLYDNIDNFPFEVSFDNRILDTKEIALFIDILLGKRRQKYNLSDLVKCFGVKKGKAHRADEDVRMTADLIENYMKLKDAAVMYFNEAYK